MYLAQTRLSMYLAQTRLSIDTAPREIKEITAEVAEWTERQTISGRSSDPLYSAHLGFIADPGECIARRSARPCCVSAVDRAGE